MQFSKGDLKTIMRNLVILALLAVSAIAQTPAPKVVPPAGYIQVNVPGVGLSWEPLLATVASNYVNMVESESFLALDNEGLNTIAAVQNGLTQWSNSYCSSTWGNLIPDCANPQATIAPYMQRIQIDFSLVPASQWSVTGYSSNLPANVAGYLALPPVPPPPPPAPTNQPLVSLPCTVVGGVNSPVVTICYPGPGSTVQNTTNGEIVTGPDGNLYVAHKTMTAFGYSMYFSPVLNPTAAQKAAAKK
jgi:hypothetical protein